MKKIAKMRICAYVCAVLAVIMLFSAIQLEVNPAGAPIWVLCHIGVGILFFEFLLWHCVLNQKSLLNQFSRNRKAPAKNGLRWLTIFFVLTLLSALIALAHWLVLPLHSVVGGIHGKLGFIFLIMATIHTLRHKKFLMKVK